MGSPPAETCRELWTSLETAHGVSLSTAFAISPFETTRRQFADTMGYAAEPEAGCPTCPVAQVSWHEAASYCNRLSESAAYPLCYSCSGSASATRCSVLAGYAGKDFSKCQGYRLPTEAEWEYAYRAGQDTAAYWGTVDSCVTSPSAEAYSWHLANGDGLPHPVGTKAPNPWGLFDMAGNLWEWCHDWHEVDLGSAAAVDPVGATSGTHRVTRGGSFDDNIGKHRAAMRDSERPTLRRAYLGFRCVRSQP